MQDLTGMKFGRWTVIQFAEYRGTKAYWECKCECGNIKVVSGNNLIYGKSKSCGCLARDITSKRSVKDLTGKRFGRLVVLKLDHMNANHNAIWKCKCDCGNICLANSAKLQDGTKKSCGCLQREVTVKRTTTHGLSHTRIYKLWRAMYRRCYYKNTDNYQYYGGRGIQICKEWYTPGSYDGLYNFIEWAYNNGYQDQPKNTPLRDLLTLERKDPNRDYCPENCIWIPFKYQASNTRSNKIIYDGDEKLTYSQFDRKYGKPEGFTRTHKYRKWSLNAIVLACKCPERGIHRTTDNRYLDQDEFEVLVPRYDKRN